MQLLDINYEDIFYFWKKGNLSGLTSDHSKKDLNTYDFPFLRAKKKSNATIKIRQSGAFNSMVEYPVLGMEIWQERSSLFVMQTQHFIKMTKNQKIKELWRSNYLAVKLYLLKSRLGKAGLWR